MIINEKIGSFAIELIDLGDLNSVKTSTGEMVKKNGGNGGKRLFD
jgi:hypothetical protein